MTITILYKIINRNNQYTTHNLSISTNTPQKTKPIQTLYNVIHKTRDTQNKRYSKQETFKTREQNM